MPCLSANGYACMRWITVVRYAKRAAALHRPRPQKADITLPDLQAVGCLQQEERAAAAGLWPAALLSTAPVDCVAQLHLLSDVLEGRMGGWLCLTDGAGTNEHIVPATASRH